MNAIDPISDEPVNENEQVGNTILTSEQKCYFRNLFRDARAKAQKNVDNFQDILFTLEKLGVTLKKPQTTNQANLGQYKGVICELVMNAPLDRAQQGPLHITFNDLYDLVRNNRNDALHQGAVARNLTSRAVRLALIIEDALMSESYLVKHFMVTNVIIAESWHPLWIIRQQMLENSFSYLPFFDKEQSQWFLIADYQIAKYIRVSNSKRIPRLSQSLADALKDRGLKTDKAEICDPDDPIADVLEKDTDKPHIVIKQSDVSRPYGIVSAFDIL